MDARMHLLTAVAGLALVSNVAMAAGEQPVLVPSPVEKVFVALGFDDNDDVELVLHGHFPNTCYKVGPISAAFDAATGLVEISAQSYRYPGGCAQVIVNFTQTVKVGLLPRGTYDLKVNGEPGLATAPLVITQALTNGPDDFLYAPVREASLDQQSDGTYAVTIKGEYPYMFVGCMILTEVRTYMSPGNTLVVLPIAELIEDERCEAQQFTHSFAATRSIGALTPGEYLVHVRVVEGVSLNRFFEIQPN
jgi:hypothetical protein